jgi:hypothetical protein
MKDELKIFADQHRESFESYHVDQDDLWRGIEDKLDQMERGSTIPWSIIWKVAAVLLIVSTVGLGFFLNSHRVSVERNGIALHNISADMADTEAFYTSQIDEKIRMIRGTAGDLDPSVQSQLSSLDEEYQSLKNDLKDNADSEEVINAMIEYYRLKLAMLEKILSEIQENNDTNSHEEVQAI